MTLAWLVGAWAAMAAVFTSVALFRLSQPRRPLAISGPGARSVVLIRPLDLPGPHELLALRSPLVVEGAFEHIVASPERPHGLPATVRWVPSDPSTSNRKVGHVLNVIAQLGAAPDRVVLCIDADVVVDAALVAGLVSPIVEGDALSFAAPRPEAVSSLAGRAVRGLLVQSHHSFRALDAMQAGAKAICGKAIALSAQAREAWATLGDVVGEDLELSKLLHANGAAVTLIDAPALVVQNPHLTAGDVINRFTRWMQVLRAHRGALSPSVPLFFAPTPVLVVLTGLTSDLPFNLFAVVALVVVRTLLAQKLEGRWPGFKWLLAESLLLVCWVRALFWRDSLVWRGRRYRLSRGGHLERAS